MEAELSARRRKGAAETPAQPSPAEPAVGASGPSAPAAIPSGPYAPAPVVSPAPVAPPLPTQPMPVTTSPGTTVQPGAVATVAELRPTGSSLRVLRWVGAGVTLALAGGALLSGVAASSKYDDLKSSCGATSTGCSNGDINGVKSRALLTNVLWGAAGVVAIGTGVIFYLTPRQSAVQVAWRF